MAALRASAVPLFYWRTFSGAYAGGGVVGRVTVWMRLESQSQSPGDAGRWFALGLRPAFNTVSIHQGEPNRRERAQNARNPNRFFHGQ